MSLDREQAHRYQAYLLRMWGVPSEQSNRPPTWRFSLVHPETGEERGFPDVGALTDYLLALMGRSLDGPRAVADPGLENE
jgi:hypothetical protein